MKASISVVCYRSKTLSNGENPLMLQISKDGKRKYKSLGISLNPKFWDFTKNKPKSNCPNAELIKKIILDKITEYNNQILEFNAIQKDYTASTLIEQKQKKYLRITVKQFYEDLISNLDNQGKRGNLLVYRYSLSSIKDFTNNKLNILFSDIDIDWLNRYEQWLRSKKNKETTMSVLFRTLRSVYNKAIEQKYANKSDYPFTEFRVNKFNTTTPKRAIKKEDIIKIIEIDLSQESKYMQFSRDIFVFSYLSAGINLTDIANLKFENIKEKELHYTRQKTGKNINIPLSDKATEIIIQYSQDRAKDNYIFPILDIEKHTTPTQKHNRIHKVLGHINKSLKTIAEKTDLKHIDLTTYVARHSFATTLKRAGVSTSIICESMGHSSEKVTQIYLDSFENKQMESAMNNLL